MTTEALYSTLLDSNAFAALGPLLVLESVHRFYGSDIKLLSEFRSVASGSHVHLSSLRATMLLQDAGLTLS